MFDHLEFTVGSIEASRRFYRAVCEALGAEEVFFDGEARAVGFGDRAAVAGRVASPHLRLTEGRPVTPTLHLCLKAAGKDRVIAAFAAALAHGGRDNGAPGYRPDYGLGYFAAFVHDPDGHNIEFLHREPPAGR